MSAPGSSGTRSVRRPAGREREKQLLEAALRLFSRVGYRETSLQQIAEGLGITRPLFYYYFDSKEDLLQRLIGHLGDSLLERAKPIFAASHDPVRTLHEVLRIHAATVLGNPDAFRIYFAEREFDDRRGTSPHLTGEREYAELITTAISQGQAIGAFRAGRPRILGLCATNLVNSVLSWYSPSGPMTAEEIAELVADMAMAGLRSDC